MYLVSHASNLANGPNSRGAQAPSAPPWSVGRVIEACWAQDPLARPTFSELQEVLERPLAGMSEEPKTLAEEVAQSKGLKKRALSFKLQKRTAAVGFAAAAAARRFATGNPASSATAGPGPSASALRVSTSVRPRRDSEEMRKTVGKNGKEVFVVKKRCAP